MSLERPPCNVRKRAFISKCLRISSNKPGQLTSSLALDTYTARTARSPLAAQLDFDADRELQRFRKVVFVLLKLYLDFKKCHSESFCLFFYTLHISHERRFDAAVVPYGVYCMDEYVEECLH